jgi:CheY-like chemotaxis protein
MILVVDDDPRITMMVRTVLEREGESVASVANGVEAYGVLKSRQFTMMLLDVNMPELSGTELLDLMKDEGIKTPTIVTTGSEGFDAASFAAYPFVVGFERKPFDILKVVAAIRCLRGRKVRVRMVTATRMIDGDLTLPAAVDMPAFLARPGAFIALNNALVTHGDGSTVLAAAEVCLRADSIVCASVAEKAPTGNGAGHGAD